jgi:ribosomal protein S18 acetylase RimI-like enzyme
MAGFEVLEENLRTMLAIFGRANGSGESRNLDGVAATSSAIQFSMFNSAVLTAPVLTARELEDRIRSAGAFFAPRRLPWSFWLCRDWLAYEIRNLVVDVFHRNGLHLVIDLPGMAAERLAPPVRPLPLLECRRVEDARTRADFSHIMAVAFGIPAAVAREVYESEGTWSGDFTGYVGYAGRMPVTSAAVLAAGAAVGVYAVGTVPAEARKGYAEAVMRHALERARETSGIEFSVLESSDAGFTLYRAMGYRTVTRYAVFGT